MIFALELFNCTWYLCVYVFTARDNREIAVNRDHKTVYKCGKLIIITLIDVLVLLLFFFSAKSEKKRKINAIVNIIYDVYYLVEILLRVRFYKQKRSKLNCVNRTTISCDGHIEFVVIDSTYKCME